MSFSLLIADYTRWHYTIAPGALFHIWLNFMRYIEQLFSVRLHLMTLFAPWHRVSDHPRKQHDIEEYAMAFVVNVMSRLIGCILRTFLIVVGFSALIVLGASIIPGMLIWYLAPLIVSGCLIVGIAILIFFYGNSW